MVIENGKEVAFHYTLTVEGETVDSSREREPLKYKHGEQGIIPGLSEQLEGMRAGDKKNVVLGPEKAYGDVNPDARQEVPKAQFPEGAQLQPGQPVQVSTPDGKMFVVKVADLKDDTVVLDMNHPLAGKTLSFDVEIVDVS